MYRLLCHLPDALARFRLPLASVMLGLVAAGMDAGLHKADAAARFWYYCDSPPGYFPYVQGCTSPYRAVPVPDNYTPATTVAPVVPKHHHHHRKHVAQTGGAATAPSAGPADLDDLGGTP